MSMIIRSFTLLLVLLAAWPQGTTAPLTGIQPAPLAAQSTPPRAGLGQVSQVN